jgi:fumarate hydratase class I
MNAPVPPPSPAPLPEYKHTPLFPLGKDTTTYRKLEVKGADGKPLANDGVTVEKLAGRDVVVVSREAMRALAEEAFNDINHLLRPAHLQSLRNILDDKDATGNDKFVAYDLLKNANIAAGGVLPMCQDTGTAIIMGKRGRRVFIEGEENADEAALAEGARDAYLRRNLRYSQLAPISMFEEKNTRSNMPAQVEIYAEGEDAYKFLFIAKGGGSANKSLLFQETKALLNEKSLAAFLDQKLRSLGTAACPPYHLAVVIGGTSAEFTLKVAKYASARYLDHLPTKGSAKGHAYRDLEWEQKVVDIARATGIGAQFGGKYFVHDARVIRLPRHGASCPVAIAVSCSADRQALGKITKDGVFLEQLETDPAKYLPDVTHQDLGGDVVKIDLNMPMSEIRAALSRYPIKTRLVLSGPLIVARDIAHAKLKERLDRGEGLPQYMKDHAVYYAGPA